MIETEISGRWANQALAIVGFIGTVFVYILIFMILVPTKSNIRELKS